MKMLFLVCEWSRKVDAANQRQSRNHGRWSGRGN